MKLKKKVKIIIVVLLVIALGVAGYFAYEKYFNKGTVKEAKVVSKIDKYGYTLKDNKPEAYKKMFKELKKILETDPVDEEAYAKKISEMFIYDFYSLADKTAKTDVGGVDFVYSGVLDNFLENAQNTYYKYVENNIYNNRNQKLPVVDEIKINNIEKNEFTYGENSDPEAYHIKVSWTYTDEDTFGSYQKEAELVFIHDDIKLSLVELQ